MVSIITFTIVSLKKQNASLEEILWELKEKTQLVFMYSDEDIASVKGIDIDMKNTQVDAILNKCLEGTDLKYVRENNAIVIRRSRQSECPAGTDEEDFR